jgi:protein phosphatase
MKTSVGAVRERNEDAGYVDGKHRFFVVADGMGGHSAGDVASALAVSVVRVALEDASPQLASFATAPTRAGREEIRLLLEQAVRAANHAVLARSQRELDKHGMGTTLEVALVLAGEAFVSHVGDSRTYLMRDEAAVQATIDHTVAQVMRRAGTLSPEEADTSPMRSVLSNAIGISADVAVDHVHLRLRPGDRLLLCSDGLYEYFTPNELAAWVSHHPGEAALAGLIDQACSRGGSDNITGIVVEVPLASAAPEEVLDDAPTSPISLPPDTAPTPIVAVADDALSAFVEQALREASGPHSAPRD